MMSATLTSHNHADTEAFVNHFYDCFELDWKMINACARRGSSWAVFGNGSSVPRASRSVGPNQLDLLDNDVIHC